MNRIIDWFVHNPVAANLLMLMIIFSGFLNIPNINKEFFPQVPSNTIVITVPYLGAGPKEVEEQICIRIEEAIHDLDGIDKLYSTAREGSAEISVDVETDYDVQKLLNEIKTRVDALSTLPQEAERPQIQEAAWHHQMMALALSGDVSETTLKRYAEKVRDELANLDNVSLVEIKATRPYEISVDLSELTLRRYGLQFEQVVQAIRNSSLNLPAGSIRSEIGDIQLQTRGQAYTAADFEKIVLLRNLDGTQVRLGDIATIHDGFEDQNIISRINGNPAVLLDVNVTNNPDVLKTSKSVNQYIAESANTLPDGLSLAIWRDTSNPFRDRVKTLITNGVGGLILVFGVLMLFLRPLLAFWVSVGIAVSFLGTFWLLPLTGVSLNMLSLFAFLLILGIVVDDAIIVGESVYRENEASNLNMKGASLGTQRVSKPISFAVISTIMVFVPMFFLPGDTAHSAEAIPAVVILTLIFSIIECFFILPSHLSHMPKPKEHTTGPLGKLSQLRKKFSNGMLHASQNIYRPFLELCLEWRWGTIAGFIGVFVIVFSLFLGGWLKTAFFPNVTSDFLRARITMAEGSAFSETEAVLKRVEQAALTLQKQHTYQDEFGVEKSFINFVQVRANDNRITGWLVLDPEQRAGISASAVNEEWRELIGEIPNADDVHLSYTINRGGKAIEFELSGPDNEALLRVSNELQQQLKRYHGVYDVVDSMQTPRPEIELGLKPLAESLDLSLSQLARQVRQGFYGAEAQRIPRDREDVKVMVRYTKEERESLDHLNNIRVRTPQGEEVPFATVAEVRYVPSYSKIERIDRQRTITVSASLAKHTTEAMDIVNDVMENYAPQWQAAYPGLSIKVEGEQLERAEFVTAMKERAVQALLAIFALFAVAFRSYWQPIIILTAVPFGFMGSIVGHMIMGREMSIFSFLGILACAGVVVNDNLVLIDRINQLREQGLAAKEALLQAGQDRFRPIILTSLTTFIGLLPIMSETSLQAQFLIPMVISLAFGVLLATFITLLLVPSLYLIGENGRQVISNIFSRISPNEATEK